MGVAMVQALWNRGNDGYSKAWRTVTNLRFFEPTQQQQQSFCGSLSGSRDYPGEPVPEETFTHPPS